MRLSYFGWLYCYLRLFLSFASISKLNEIGLGITFPEYIKDIKRQKIIKLR